MSSKLARFSRWLRARTGGREPSPAVQVETGPTAFGAAEEPARRRAGPDPRAMVLSVFDPVHPVKHRGELCGRDAELDQLNAAVLDQGKHAIIHGARGSGKTSLVQVFGVQADEAGAVVIYLAAEARVRFDELLADYMRFIPESALSLEGRANLAERAAELKQTVRSQTMVELLQSGLVRPLVLVLDEFDRITDRRVQVELATFMKLLADTRAPVQFVLVGIARSVAEVIDHHPSLRRHLIAVPVGRLSDAGLRNLIDHGAAQCGLSFSSAAVEIITRVAAGSPYHARLFALEAALNALKSDRLLVDADHVRAGLLKAVDDWSRLNPEGGSVIAPIVRLHPELRTCLVEVARAAALADEFAPPNADDGAADVNPAQELLDKVRRRLRLDSLAPQFLLAMLELSPETEAVQIAPTAVAALEPAAAPIVAEPVVATEPVVEAAPPAPEAESDPAPSPELEVLEAEAPPELEPAPEPEPELQSPAPETRVESYAVTAPAELEPRPVALELEPSTLDEDVAVVVAAPQPASEPEPEPEVEPEFAPETLMAAEAEAEVEHTPPPAAEIPVEPPRLLKMRFGDGWPAPPPAPAVAPAPAPEPPRAAGHRLDLSGYARRARRSEEAS